MITLSPYGQRIINDTPTILPVYLDSYIPFTGVAGEKLQPVYTPNVDDDVLIYGATVDFLNYGVSLKIVDTATGYQFNISATPSPGTQISYTPIHAIAGSASQVQPILPLPIEFLLKRQSRIQMEFINAYTSPLPSTQKITWAGYRLINRK